MYEIGGAPEGVISATAIQALGGDMQARLLPRHQVQADTKESRPFAADELQRCQQMGIKIQHALPLDQLVKHNKVVVSVTGISCSDLVQGIRKSDQTLNTETLLINGSDRSVRRIQACYYRK